MENKQYTTKENIVAYLGETITENIDLYILSAQEYIDKYCGRNFKGGEEDEVRYFSGVGTRDLIIDPAIAITKVEISTDEGLTFTVVEDYIAQPLNETPKVKLTLRSNCFPAGLMSVKITGQFGWGECVPKDITYCATLLASMMYKGNSLEDIVSERIGDYSVNYQAEGNKEVSVKDILNTYKKLF